MVSSINRIIAERLLNEIRIHDINLGGKMVAILGSKGSGKSHFLTRLAHQMVFLHPLSRFRSGKPSSGAGAAWIIGPGCMSQTSNGKAPSSGGKCMSITPSTTPRSSSTRSGTRSVLSGRPPRPYPTVVDLHTNLVLGDQCRLRADEIPDVAGDARPPARPILQQTPCP